MVYDLQTCERQNLAYQNLWLGSFGEGIGGRIEDRLFRTTAGHDAQYALEQSSILMSCVYKITLQAGLDQDDTLAWVAHYLSGMAKALVEDVAHVMMTGD
ncbi:DUF3077 domain-containing protein [Pseudomonas sp. GZD-222]|uniref:DUF3077 domain-containing protein n=1 Tax=Pseudomonas sp. GZD-222 TaxID=3404805 RepID=UPI003BB7B8D0